MEQAWQARGDIETEQEARNKFDNFGIGHSQYKLTKRGKQWEAQESNKKQRIWQLLGWIL